MVYAIVKLLTRIALRLLYRIRYVGTENVPPEGPVILCSNHSSYWDPLIIGASLNRTVRFMAKKELFRVPIVRELVKALRAFPVDRDNPDRTALRTALELLRSGSVLGIFPEGTRHKDGELGKAYSGAALIAKMSGAPVIPVAIIGSDKIVPKGKKLPRFPKLEIRFGKPMDFDLAPGTRGREQLDAMTERIMQGIRELLVSSRKGS